MKWILLVVLAFAASARGNLLYYDGQTPGSTYTLTAYAPGGLSYTMANSQPMNVTGGHRVTNGLGDSGGNDYLSLNLAPGDVFDQSGLYDAGSGTLGGGAVSGTVYISGLVRAQNASGTASENKSGVPGGTYAAVQFGSFGLGNHWTAWAYSIFGPTGDQDLTQASGGSTHLQVDTSVRWLVAKITFNPNAPDDVSVWLDPNPDLFDNQNAATRRYIASGAGDFSFNTIGYRSGNLGALSAWEFDEVRIGTDWASMNATTVVPEPSALGLLTAGLLSLAAVRRRI